MAEQRPPIRLSQITMRKCMAIAAAQSPGIPIPGGATITLPPLAVDGMRARTAPIGPEDVVEEDDGDDYGIEQADKDFACSCADFLLVF